MATSALVDAGFLVALLSRRDANHRWAAEQAPHLPPPWVTCEALLRRGAVVCAYRFADDMDAVLRLLEKYADVPMSFADACLVRMTERLNNPMLLTTDADFRIYRRHGRQIIPCVLPD
jgi:predicted nucleic acid-binding protein